MKKFTFAGVMIGLLVAGPLSAAGEMVADDGRLERRMPTVNGSRAAMDFPGHPGSERRLDGFMLSEGDVTTDMQPVLEPFRATDDSVENVFDPIQQPDQRRMQKQFTGGDWSQDGARHGQAEVRTGPAGSDEGAAKTFIRPDALPKDLFAPGVQELMRDQQFAVPGKSGSELDMESLQEKGRTEPRVAERSVPSPLERQVGADELLSPSRTKPANLAKNIQQFGYSFFRETKFAADRNLPVTADYLLAPGDTLVVTVWGAVNGTYEVPINRSGEVAIPKVGPVKLAGLPFGSVRDVLKNRLASIYRNFDLSVNMGRLRTIKVYVVGEVAAPGDYSVSGLGTVINALGAAGGPTKNGSLRNIKVRRAAGGEEPVDLYDFFTNGDKSRDIRLQSGDTIFVPVIGRVVAVAGNVKRPAIYELKHEQTLKEVLSLAEGITATGNLQQVQISRTEANAKKSVIDLNLDPLKAGKPLDELAAAVKINDLDVVRVYGISGLLRGHVKISGHVERQGYYAIAPGQRISGVLAADNLLPEYHTELLEITRLVPPDLHREKLLLKLSAALAKDPAHDIELKEFDTLRVFSRWDLEERLTVRVNGEVQQPGQYRHYSGMTVRDLLVQAGNPKASAFLKNAEISRLSLRNERAQMEPITINLDEVLKGDPAHNLVLAPFDELNVRRIPNWATEKDRYVKLSGEFVFPGTYPIYRGERLSSVIARAGGFTDKAYLPGAKYTREIVRKLQQQRLDESMSMLCGMQLPQFLIFR